MQSSLELLEFLIILKNQSYCFIIFSGGHQQNQENRTGRLRVESTRYPNKIIFTSHANFELFLILVHKNESPFFLIRKDQTAKDIKTKFQEYVYYSI